MWNYLDDVNKNLLYRFAYFVSGKYKQIFSAVTGETKETMKERKCRESFYLIWFVYRYALGCETLTEALEYADEDTLEKYKLKVLFVQHYMHIGLQGEIIFRKWEDIYPVLEILYNRYPLMQQMSCAEKYASAKRKGQCKRIRQKYERMLEIYKERQK